MFLLNVLLLAVAVLIGLAAPAWAGLIRVSKGDDRTVVRILATRPHGVRWVWVPGGVRWEAKVARPKYGSEKKYLSRGPIKEIVTRRDGRKLTITMRWRFPLPDLEPRTTSRAIEFRYPDRISRTSKVALKPGVVYQRVSRFTPAGFTTVHVLRLRLSDADLKLRMADSRDLFQRETVAKMVRNYRALAGINGSYFAPATAAPIGLLYSEGQILSSSFLNRSVFGIRKDGTCFISRSRLFAAIAEDGGKVYLASAVNKKPKRGKIVLYTPHWGARTRSVPDPSRREFSIGSGGKVLAAGTGNLAIPRGGYVLSAQGEPTFELRRRIRVGMPLRIFSRLNGEFEGAKYAVGGGPTLVKDGRVNVTARGERFGPEIATGRAARTAIGYFGGKDVALVTVDGRPRGADSRLRTYSAANGMVGPVGMTLHELGRFLRELGVREAMNLDGGGSSTMVVRGRTVNHPVEGAQRPVHNALLVF